MSIYIYVHTAFVENPVHMVMDSNRVSKSCSMAEICFHLFVHFGCALIYIFCFYQKQYASQKKDFTFVKFICQMFSSADESLKSKTCLLLL